MRVDKSHWLEEEEETLFEYRSLNDHGFTSSQV